MTDEERTRRLEEIVGALHQHQGQQDTRIDRLEEIAAAQQGTLRGIQQTLDQVLTLLQQQTEVLKEHSVLLQQLVNQRNGQGVRT